MTTVTDRPANPEVVKAMKQIFGEMMFGKDAYKAISTVTTNYMHGPGGIFGVSGLERDLISTRVKPMGLLDVLPSFGTVRTNPLFPYFTGTRADVGSEPAGVCDDPPVAGMSKACIQTAQFGRYSRQTKAIEINRVGQQIDRGEFMDLNLVNDPILDQAGGLIQQSISGGPDLNREVLQAFVEVGISFQNLLYRQLYTGNPTNNNAGGGYKEFAGLDLLIGTTKVDALTGIACPSLASDIKDFNYGLVSDSTPDIIQVLTYLLRYLNWNAQTMGLDPVEFAIAMRPELFYELTAIWPCSYLSYRCSPRTGSTQFIDSADAVGMRDAMREGQYLLVDGKKFNVVLDTGIVEDTNTTVSGNRVPSGQFASDIYVIPLRVKNGFQATYMQYLDYQQGAIMAIQDGRLSSYYWTDGGRFLWHAKPPQAWCTQWMAKIEPRVILHTPQLAGKITNVRYAPLQHTRDPFPSDPYFLNGGVVSRTGPSYYSDWNPE